MAFSAPEIRVIRQARLDREYAKAFGGGHPFVVSALTSTAFENRSAPVNLLLDVAAPGSILPRHLIHYLGLEPTESKLPGIRTVFGTTSPTLYRGGIVVASGLWIMNGLFYEWPADFYTELPDYIKPPDPVVWRYRYYEAEHEWKGTPEWFASYFDAAHGLAPFGVLGADLFRAMLVAFDVKPGRIYWGRRGEFSMKSIRTVISGVSRLPGRSTVFVEYPARVLA